MRIATLLLGLLLLAVPSSAENAQHFKNGSPVVLQPEMAYLLYRSVVHEDWINPVERTLLIRVLTPDELSEIQAPHDKNYAFKTRPNLIVLVGNDAYAKSGTEWTYVAAVPPGAYILAGPPLLCMGTVQFEARAGVITDLGYILKTRSNGPTEIPELKPYAPAKHRVYFNPLLYAVRPYADGMFIPAALANLPRVSADYRAVDRFPNYLHFFIGRLAPVPGVLDYDAEGNVVDLKANKSAAQAMPVSSR